MVSQEQLGQVKRIFGIVFCTAGHEGLSVFLESQGVDGIEGDPLVGFEVSHEMGRRLFQAEGDPTLWIFLAQLQQPFPERFRRSVDGLGVTMPIGNTDEVQIGFAIGTIQTDNQVIGRSVHTFNYWVNDDVLFSRKA
jgi:hypothetical protein